MVSENCSLFLFVKVNTGCLAFEIGNINITKYLFLKTTNTSHHRILGGCKYKIYSMTTDIALVLPEKTIFLSTCNIVFLVIHSSHIKYDLCHILVVHTFQNGELIFYTIVKKTPQNPNFS